MTVRERLPNRRPSTTFDFEVAGLHYTATVSQFNDGRIGELFINNHKSNSAADTNARDAAIACSPRPAARRRRRNHPQSVPRQPRSRQCPARSGARHYCKGQPIPMSTKHLLESVPARHMDATTAERGGAS